MGIALHQVFQDKMVVQREKAFILTGTAKPHTTLNIRFREIETEITVGIDSHFEANLGVHAAGGPYTLEVYNEEEALILQDIYLGDVFILAGQSNMELPLGRCLDQMGERFLDFEDPLIREIKPPMVPVFDKAAKDYEAGSNWHEALDRNKYEMSALGLSFARQYRSKVDVAVGLINIAVGGSPIEAWMDVKDLADEPIWQEIFEQFKEQGYRDRLILEESTRSSAWYERLDMSPKGLWEDFSFPQMFFDLRYEEHAGTVWLKRSFDLNEEELKTFDGQQLFLGSMVDSDIVFLNGEKVGETGYRYPPRRYPLPQGLLKIGSNEILIRLTVFRGRGGIVEGRFYGLKAGDKRFDLSGNWQISEGVRLEPLAEETFLSRVPGSLYQGLWTPLEGVSATAVLWYQGEGNDGRPDTYEMRFRTFVESITDLPFVFVQLSAYEDPTRLIEQEAWAVIREAQRRVAKITGAGMVVSVDCGELHDLHPQDKWTLGVRMDLQVRHLLGLLDEGECAFGPDLLSIEVVEGQTIVSFSNVDELIVQGKLEDALMVLDKAGVWQKVEDVTVKGNTLLIRGVWQGVRYNFEPAPIDTQLYNEARLPASPFEYLSL